MRSFTILLTILFIGLKLTGYIDWSWWFVLSPLIVWAALLVILTSTYAYLKYKEIKNYGK